MSTATDTVVETIVPYLVLVLRPVATAVAKPLATPVANPLAAAAAPRLPPVLVLPPATAVISAMSTLASAALTAT